MSIGKKSIARAANAAAKAAEENILAVIDPVMHGLEMLLGEGSANCAR